MIPELVFTISGIPSEREGSPRVASGSVVAWQHINLHGEYDFAPEKLQDSVGLEVPKIRQLEVG